MSHTGDEVKEWEEYGSDEATKSKTFDEVYKKFPRRFFESVNPGSDRCEMAADMAHVPSCSKVRPKLMGEGAAESLAVSKRPRTEEAMETRNKRVFNDGFDLGPTSAADYSKDIRNLTLQQVASKGKACTGGAHVDCQGGSPEHNSRVELEFESEKEKVIFRMDATRLHQDTSIRISFKSMCFELNGKQAV